MKTAKESWESEERCDNLSRKVMVDDEGEEKKNSTGINFDFIQCSVGYCSPYFQLLAPQ